MVFCLGYGLGWVGVRASGTVGARARARARASTFRCLLAAAEAGRRWAAVLC